MSRVKDFYHDAISDSDPVMVWAREKDAGFEELNRKDTIAAINTELAKRNAVLIEAARITRKQRIAARFGRTF